MHTFESLQQDLKNMGLKPTDAVLVHTSLKAIGPVAGGGEAVADALVSYFAPGQLMAPAHTWAQMNENYTLFDPATEPACVGVLPNLLLKHAGAVRSAHPTHSMVVFGKNAAEYVRGEENCQTPCPPGGCWDRLRQIDGKILLIGVTHARNTFIHSVEEVLNVPERLTGEQYPFQIKMPDGSIRPAPMRRHYNRHTAHISDSFDKLAQAYLETGAAVEGRLGDAKCLLCDAKALFAVTKQVLSHEINCIIDRETIPTQWWQSESSCNVM